MTSRTGIPEAITGFIAAWFSVWIFPSAVSIQQFIMSDAYKATVDVNSASYTQMLLASAGVVLNVAFFVIVAVYCSIVVVEKIYYWYKEKK